jgi:hypothetical protein
MAPLMVSLSNHPPVASPSNHPLVVSLSNHQAPAMPTVGFAAAAALPLRSAVMSG